MHDQMKFVFAPCINQNLGSWQLMKASVVMKCGVKF